MKTRKTLYVILPLIAVVAVLAIAYFTVGNGSNSEQEQETATSASDKDSKTTSTEPTAQSDFSGATGDREPGNSLSEDKGTSTVENSDEVVVSDDPVVSEDGNTTLYSPSKNDSIKSGSIISGKTQNDNVYYRLIDNKSGVTGEGELKIVDGNFSAKLTVDSRSTEGRLDIFSRYNDGTEYSVINLDVRFD